MSAVMAKPPRVLLVEDNENDELLALHALHGAGIVCDIEVARDGEEAITRLLVEGDTGAAATPDLVLLDLNLPKVDGHEVLRRMRADERTRNTPVVVLTTSRETQDVARAYQLGANSFVCKPIDFDEFQSCTRLILTLWLKLNVVPPGGTC